MVITITITTKIIIIKLPRTDQERMTKIFQRSERNKIILILGNRTIWMGHGTNIIGKNISNSNEPLQQDRIDNSRVFECFSNTISQNTTTNHHQTHNTVQDLNLEYIHW